MGNMQVFATKNDNPSIITALFSSNQMSWNSKNCQLPVDDLP